MQIKYNILTPLKLETVYFFHLSLKIKKLWLFKIGYTVPYIGQFSTESLFHKNHHIFSDFLFGIKNKKLP